VADKNMNRTELASLVGHRFPGGTYRVEHWENWLLTDCTGSDPLPHGIVHPIVLFHAPILGAGTSIGELFRLGGATGAGGSVGLLGYDWELFEPMIEDVTYRVDGGIVGAERRHGEHGAIADDVAFSITLHDVRQPAAAMTARITNRWRFRRSETRMAATAEPADSAATGELLPTWEVATSTLRG
jgi:hypothetical protein